MTDAPIADVATPAAPVAETSTPVADAATPAPEADAPAVADTPVEPATPAVVEKPAVNEQPAAELDKPAEPEKPAEEAKPTEPAPIEYTDFALPEGADFPDDARAEFTSFAKELGLTQENAQKLLDKYLGITTEASNALTAEVQGIWSEWQNEFKASKLGGENAEKTLAEVNGMLTKCFTDEDHAARFDEFQKTFGIGNNLAFIELLHNIAQKTKEDTTSGFRSGEVQQSAMVGQKLVDHYRQTGMQ